MGISVSKAGPYFSSGSISFSQLRDTFRFSGGTIRASELRRDTNVSNPNPIVPDATENSAISTGSNLRLSQFRNSIKYYSITQSGTDFSISLHANEYWNGNLGKNIVKNTYVTGTCGENSIERGAARHRGDQFPTRNLTITISGQIYGAAGTGSNTPGGSGIRGGGAFRAEGSGGGNATLRVIITSGARVWAGGGGGERGKDGEKGADGLCRQIYTVSACGSVGGCPPGYFPLSTGSGGVCNTICTPPTPPSTTPSCTSIFWQYLYCALDYVVPGGAGGAGGAGANGRGYNNFGGSLLGSPGAPGQPGTSCGSVNITLVQAQPGQPGEKGGDGGDWGRPGGNTSGTGRGGFQGPAIVGRNFTLSGNVNSNTVKGIIDYNFSESSYQFF